MRSCAWALVLATGPALAAAPGAQEPTKAAGAPSLADVAWIAGHWEDRSQGNLSEEVWTAPEGDSMLGMWRLVVGGKAKVVELLSLGSSDDGVVLRLRHFDPAFVAREEKTEPVVLKLIEHGGAEAIFEGPAVGAAGTLRLTYRKVADVGLAVTLEKPGSKREFRFKRATR